MSEATAAKMPPMPDARIPAIEAVRERLARLISLSKDELRDEVKEAVEKCRMILATLETKVRALHKDKVAVATAEG
jgi:hypothetical protein